MSIEYEQLMRQLQETEDGEPLGKSNRDEMKRNFPIFFV